MKIVINTAHQRFGGAIQVALSFIYECRNFTDHEYHVWVGPGVRKSLNEADFPANFHFQHFDFGVITLWKTFQINRTLREAEKAINPDCIIATSGPSYFHSRAPQIIGFNLPLYIYPESPYLKKLSFYRKLKMGLKKQLHFYFFKRDADAYVVQTDDVNHRVQNALNSKQVYTVSNTYNGFYDNPSSFEPKLPPKQKNEWRFLTLTAYYPHKDLELIPKVTIELEKRGINNVRFVLTLNQQDFEQKIGEYKDKIWNVGPVKPPEAPGLYQECDGMFLPTLAECFSASYPEAMVMERPIVTTDLGFARSICGEAALYYEPQNAKAAADAIERLLDDTQLQQQLIQKGREQLQHFDTARQRAEKYLALCERLVSQSSSK